MEDDHEFGLMASEFLTSAGYEIFHLSDADNISAHIDQFKPDMILLDRILPGADGYKVAGKLREDGVEIPVLFMTSLTDEESVIEGLVLRNCEYLKKPFGLKELKIRIEKQLKHLGSLNSQFSKYYLPELCAIKNGAETVCLSPSEDKLLKLLMLNQGKICSLESIISCVWGDKDVERLNRVDVLIRKLREKLKGIPYMIENHKRIGYTLKEVG